MSKLSKFADTANAWFWGRVGAATNVSPESLGLFRCFFGVYLLLFNTPHFGWIGRAPRALFDPPLFSIAYLFDSFPPAIVFHLLDVVGVLSLCGVVLGYRTRVSTGVNLVCQLVGNSFAFSFGKIDHTIMVSALFVCMLFSNWGLRYSVDEVLRHASPTLDEDRERAVRGTSLFGVILAFGMVTAGLPKALNWIDFDLGTSGFLSWFYPNRYALGREFLLAPLVPYVPSAAFELGDYSAAIFEIVGFAALVVSRRTWLLWLIVAAAFHLANALTLNIAFTTQALTYLAFVELFRFEPMRRVTEFLRLPRMLFILGAGVFAMAAAHLVQRWLAVGSDAILIKDDRTGIELSLYLSLPICTLVVTGLTLEFRRGSRGESRGWAR